MEARYFEFFQRAIKPIAFKTVQPHSYEFIT